MRLFLLSALCLLALTHAERVERFKAPAITLADGFVSVSGNCAPDIRREYQQPIARFVSEIVTKLAAHERRRLKDFARSGLRVHLGDVRTNETTVITRVHTNEANVVTHFYLPCPAEADLEVLRCEVVRGYVRAVERREYSREAAHERLLETDPDYRVARTRLKLSDWLHRAKGNDEEGLNLLYRVIKPGSLSREEALVFASRLFLYPPLYARPFLGSRGTLSFRAAIDAAPIDPAVRLAAFLKANELPIFGGGRGEGLKDAAEAYRLFLLQLAAGEKSTDELKELLEQADSKFNVVYEGTK